MITFIELYFKGEQTREDKKLIQEYLEDVEMYKNKEKLEKKFKESYESGKSDLII